VCERVCERSQACALDRCAGLPKKQHIEVALRNMRVRSWDRQEADKTRQEQTRADKSRQEDNSKQEQTRAEKSRQEQTRAD
jgi:hypothetical protein